jgi:hypothetical protein
MLLLPAPLLGEVDIFELAVLVPFHHPIRPEAEEPEKAL